MKWRRSTVVLSAALALLAVFLRWRLLRPMNIFVVSGAFERPIESGAISPVLGNLHAAECGGCHRRRSAISSRALLVVGGKCRAEDPSLRRLSGGLRRGQNRLALTLQGSPPAYLGLRPRKG